MLPMGLIVATDIFHDRISALLGELDFLTVFLDDILIIGNGSFDEHLPRVMTVLHILLKAGISCEPFEEFLFLGGS